MDRYIFDTSSISELHHFYPLRFPSLWENIDKMANNKQIYSIKEVKRELENLNKGNYDISKRENITVQFYEDLTEEDFKIVTEILSHKGNQELIHRKSINKGTPCADPFLIAKAEADKSILVTEEQYVRNATKIPTICEKRNIRCINLEQFMEEQKWSF